jgi:uncharacterized protein (DUF2267 family)
MEPSEFYTVVRQQANLESVEEAEELSDAVLRTLGERLSSGATSDLAEYLPEEPAAALETDSEPESFGPDKFLARIAERAGVEEACAERAIRATTAALETAAAGSEYRDVRQQLPSEYGTLFQEPEDAESRAA